MAQGGIVGNSGIVGSGSTGENVSLDTSAFNNNLSAADDTAQKAFDTLDDAAGGGGANLGYTASATDGTVTSDSGTNATVPAGSTTNASLMLPGDKTKLNGVATSANNYSHPNHSGDVTSVGDGAQTIANNAVTNAKAADVGTATMKGRASSGTGDPEDLTATQARTILNVADGANNYAHPNHSGDVTSVSDGVQTIANDAVTNAKAANMAASTLKGNDTGGAADPKDLTAAEARSLLNVADAANNYSHPNHSGDVTSVSDGVQTISNDAVTNAKAANMATKTFKGRDTAATGDPEDLSVETATSMLNDMVGDSGSGGTKGLAPAPTAGDAAANKFLGADGTYKVPPTTATNLSFGDRTATQYEVNSDTGTDATVTGASETEAGCMVAADKTKLNNIATSANNYTHPNHSGDVTSVADGAQTIANNAVTNAKAADVATATIKGRATAGTGDPEDLTATQTRTILNVADGANDYTHPNHSGDVTSVADGAQTIANNAVTNAKAAQMATATIKGRATAGTGNSEDLTATQARSVLNVADGANDYTHPNHTGDVTSVADGAQTIANNAVTNAKAADVGTSTFKGRATAGTGDPEDLTTTQARSLLNVADGANDYSHPNHTGDVTSVGDGAQTIANNAVTNAKAADMATKTFKGRNTAATGDPEDLSATTATAILDDMVGDSGSGGTKGLAPAPASGDFAGGKYLDAGGAYSVPSGGGGKILQSITKAIAAATASTTFPNDDTTPTTSEGTEIVSQAITPASASNKIRLSVSVTGVTANNGATLGLVAFRGSTAIGACLSAINKVNGEQTLALNVLDSPGTTSSTTYSLRVGVVTGAGAWYLNRLPTDIFNGELAKNSMTLEEVAA